MRGFAWILEAHSFLAPVVRVAKIDSTACKQLLNNALVLYRVELTIEPFDCLPEIRYHILRDVYLVPEPNH